MARQHGLDEREAAHAVGETGDALQLRILAAPVALERAGRFRLLGHRRPIERGSYPQRV